MQNEKEKNRQEFFETLEQKGITRRDFVKFCTFLTATMGFSAGYVGKVMDVFAAPAQRPPVIWLHMAECTGCSEAALRTMYPWIDQVLLDIVSMEYHETIMAAAGHQAEDNLHAAMTKYKDKYLCVIEGSIPTKFDGAYGKVGGRTFLEIARETTKHAMATICMGSCATYGGPQAAAPNPGGYKGVSEAVGIKTINIPGCPPNPINLIGTIVNYLLMGKLPALDSTGRPLFAYAHTIHDKCPRRSHFENGEFVTEFGSEEAKMGYCLYEMGCKGPETYNNCPIVKFNDGTSWPVEAGHPCIGCSEPNFWDEMSPFFETL